MHMHVRAWASHVKHACGVPGGGAVTCVVLNLHNCTYCVVLCTCCCTRQGVPHTKLSAIHKTPNQ